MKKFISLLLIFSICLSFVACGNNKTSEDVTEKTTKKSKNKHTEAIIGEWKGVDLFPFTFNEDNTGTFYSGGAYNDFTWSYNEDLKCYDIASSVLPITLNFFLKTDNDVTYLEYNGAKLYREEEFNKILPEHLDKCRLELENDYYLGVGEKIEFGKEYISNGCSVVFTELLVEDTALNLYVEITNNTSSPIEETMDIPVYVGFAITYYTPGSIGGGVGIGCDFEFIDDKSDIKPGETVILKTTISNTKVKDAIYGFGTIVGRASCVLENEGYYIDLSEYTIKEN